MAKTKIAQLFDDMVREASLSALQAFLEEVRAIGGDFPLGIADVENAVRTYQSLCGGKARPELIIAIERLILEKALRILPDSDVRNSWRCLLLDDLSESLVEEHCDSFSKSVTCSDARRMAEFFREFDSKARDSGNAAARGVMCSAIAGFDARLHRLYGWCTARRG